MIQGRDLLAVVDLLAGEPAEVFQRSLISRAYYAAYLESRALCEDHLGFVRTARGAEHQEVPSLLATIDTDLRTHLRLLRRLRNAADYDTELSAETIALSTLDHVTTRRQSLPRSTDIAPPSRQRRRNGPNPPIRRVDRR